MRENNPIIQSTNKPISKFATKTYLVYQKIDIKLTGLVPNPKLRKIAIFSVAGLFGFMFLLIVLGLIVSASTPKQQNGYVLQKPDITQTSPLPEKSKTAVQEKLIELKSDINNLNFPPNELTTPKIETKIEIK